MKGWGNQQDYGMRIYDPRVGRFLSVDPLTKNYPWYTPYQFAGNKPIRFIDLDGAEEKDITEKYWPYAVDMAQAPTSYNSASGKIIQSSYNLHGWPVNHLYFWEKSIEQNPELLDPWNKGRVLTEGYSPIFTKELKAHWEALGLPTEGLKVGDLLEHHHTNQGRMAIPITSSEHDQIPTQKNKGLKVTIPSKPGRIVNMLRKTSNTTNAISAGFDVMGLITGDPQATGSKFGKQSDVGVVYQNLESNLFYTVVSKVSEGNGVTAYFIIYASNKFDKERKKWVGAGEIGYGESYQESGGYTRTLIYNSDGKIVGGHESGTPEKAKSKYVPGRVE